MSFDIKKFKEKLITMDVIALLYILIVGGLCYILPIPEIVKGFLALPGFLIIPYLVGKTTSIFIEKILRIYLDLCTVSNFIICWCIGIISIVIIALFLNYLWLFYVQSYIILILFLMTPAVFYKKNRNLKMFIKTYGGRNTILFSLVIGIVGFLFLTYFSPYPYQMGCDYFVHSYFSEQIIEKNFIPIQPSYLMSFSILVANNILIFNLNDEPLIFWWVIQLIFYLVYAFGLYLFSYQLSKNKILSLISIIIGVFTIHHFYIPIYLFDPAPKAMILMLFPYLLFVVHNLITQKKIFNEFEIKNLIKHILFITIVFTSLFVILDRFFRLSFHSSFMYLQYLGDIDVIGIILPIFIVLVLLIIKYAFKNIIERKVLFLLLSLMCTLLFFHTSMGVCACLFILLYIICLILIEKYQRITKYLVYFVILFVFSFFILQETEILNISFFFTPYNVPDLVVAVSGFQEMKNFLKTLYSPIVIGLFILGSIYSIFYNKTQHFSLLFLVSIIFFLLFSPIEMMFRLIVFLHPIMAYFVAYGLIATGQIIFTKRSHSIHNRYYITPFIVIVLLLSVVGNSLNEIYQVVSKNSVLSCSHPSKYDAANALKYNTPDNTVILFYNSTFADTEICNRANRLHSMFPSVSSECDNEIFMMNNSIEAYKKIHYLLTTNDSSCKYRLAGAVFTQYKLRPKRYDYVIEQMRNSSVAILITKEDFKVLSREAVNKFYDPIYFTPLYNDTRNEIYIFGVNPEPGVPFKIQNNLK
ncbi:MAG: hypothetical protein BWK75_00920 [Candidatus Altiarchaeales archaeon A3]|nr:MAG: hypothetical protein BWK75_00920 [Candidatus Altiarchaeales archaeon A3]